MRKGMGVINEILNQVGGLLAKDKFHHLHEPTKKEIVDGIEKILEKNLLERNLLHNPANLLEQMSRVSQGWDGEY
ncbi:MAG: hypothetical protein Q7S12_01620 [bacterium]|nr:hypothetical protein [bacterium]